MVHLRPITYLTPCSSSDKSRSISILQRLVCSGFCRIGSLIPADKGDEILIHVNVWKFGRLDQQVVASGQCRAAGDLERVMGIGLGMGPTDVVLNQLELFNPV